jgi:hypothetical protein
MPNRTNCGLFISVMVGWNPSSPTLNKPQNQASPAATIQDTRDYCRQIGPKLPILHCKIGGFHRPAAPHIQKISSWTVRCGSTCPRQAPRVENTKLGFSGFRQQGRGQGRQTLNTEPLAKGARCRFQGLSRIEGCAACSWTRRRALLDGQHKRLAAQR